MLHDLIEVGKYFATVAGIGTALAFLVAWPIVACTSSARYVNGSN